MSTVINDQADGLRQLMKGGSGRLVAVVGSGPAVGATSVTLNLAAALQQQGRNVLMIDEHVAVAQPPSLAGSQLLQQDGQLVLLDALLDPSGALSPQAAQADHVLVVLQPNPASITAAYVCIKRLHHAHALQRLRVLVNFTTDTAEAQRVLANLALTGSRYLAVALEPAGCVRADPRLNQARRLNLNVVDAFQTSPAALDFRQIASDLPHWPRQASGLTSAAAAASSPLPEARTGQQAHPGLEIH